MGDPSLEVDLDVTKGSGVMVIDPTVIPCSMLSSRYP
jgi:hypothetical protein